MPIRDDVIFGPGPEGQRTFGQVRKLGKLDQLAALRSRLDAFLVNQVNELGWHDGTQTKVNSPFPLFLLTLVAMETLGKSLFHSKRPPGDELAQKEGFLEVSKRIDINLSKPLNNDQKLDYDKLWGSESHKKITSKAEIIYRYGRHSMAHGYRGKGVYITADDEVGIWRMNQGAIELNPYKFWIEFRRAYENSWEELERENEPTAPRTRSALQFLKELLHD